MQIRFNQVLTSKNNGYILIKNYLKKYLYVSETNLYRLPGCSQRKEFSGAHIKDAINQPLSDMTDVAQIAQLEENNI